MQSKNLLSRPSDYGTAPYAQLRGSDHPGPLDRERWQALRARFRDMDRRWPTFAILTFDALILWASLHLSAKGGWPFLGGILGLAVVLVHAYLLVHEATHSAISSRKAINDLLGHLCSWFILMPYATRQRSHLLHHTWTAHPTGDPANARVIERFSVMTDKQASRLERIWRSWLPLLTLNDRIGMWRDPFQQRHLGKRSFRFANERRLSCLYLATYVLVLIGLSINGTLGVFLLWYLPAWGILLFMEELANLPHHAEAALQDEADKALPYWEQHRVTHSCRSLPIWSPFVLLNFNLHTAHHLFPWIPWSELPEVNRELTKYLPELSRDQQTRNELAWSLVNRKRPLLEIMGHYFDKISVRHTRLHFSGRVTAGSAPGANTGCQHRRSIPLHP